MVPSTRFERVFQDSKSCVLPDRRTGITRNLYPSHTLRYTMPMAGTFAIFALATAIIFASAILAAALARDNAMSAATDRLTASVAALKTSVDAAVAKLSAPVDDTAVTAAADAVDAMKAELDQAQPAG